MNYYLIKLITGRKDESRIVSVPASRMGIAVMAAEKSYPGWHAIHAKEVTREQLTEAGAVL